MMTERFMKMVAKALYLLLLAVIFEYPYSRFGDRIDSILQELDDFCAGEAA